MPGPLRGRRRPGLRYELAAYRDTVAAGEDVRIVPTSAGRWPDLPRHDFWLLDDVELWVMEYDQDGRFLAVHENTDPEAVERQQRWRDAAWAAAVPWAAYMAAELRRPAI